MAQGKPNTALCVSAVKIASGEHQGCPPRVVRGAACQAVIASSVNRTVKLPRWRRLAPYAAQFVTLRLCSRCGGDAQRWPWTA